ncbi:hypothetical protein [Photobacterium kishitanii]|uniref:Uncharacterized protein n=1 Tax=Photobacterium kishitanii TaxID=318456 RepID=A0A2T3KLH2_9GAMM|nr:hypothetical protein [Photobacterium kishitanii]PSV00552.1 hypothetical protein C9J27_05300 [Photobacterium kishitanii]
MKNKTPFKVGKTVKFTLGRRQAERATRICNEVEMTPAQIIKSKAKRESEILRKLESTASEQDS